MSDNQIRVIKYTAIIDSWEVDITIDTSNVILEKTQIKDEDNSNATLEWQKKVNDGVDIIQSRILVIHIDSNNAFTAIGKIFASDYNILNFGTIASDPVCEVNLTGDFVELQLRYATN